MDKIVHTGVVGMKWGVRKGTKAEPLGLIPKLLGRKENFRIGKPKGMSDAEFDRQYAKETRAIGSKAVKKVANKKLSFTEREQKRRDVTKKLVVNTLLVIGTLKTMDVLAGVARTKYADVKQNKYGGFDPATVVNAKFKS